ncbi:MAG: hypothetical protein QNJ62_00770 [Methyloceanibacter sp.]|nr:hypothetical protein [Methyloceanibacter sp.]
MLRVLSLVLVIGALAPVSADAKTLSASEVLDEMLNKTIVTRQFGMNVTMRYLSGGVVTARALMGSVNGTWRAKGNKICSTFPKGPAKGTSCVSFKRTGPKQYVSSEGVRFRVVD